VSVDSKGVSGGLHGRLDILVLRKPFNVLASVRLLIGLPLPSSVRHQAAGRAHSSGLIPIGSGGVG
jgi:hypothetical protein